MMLTLFVAGKTWRGHNE